jgi:hypothetical protein
MGQFATRMTTGLEAGTAAAVMRGCKVVVQQIAVDAFGNALGSSLATQRTSSMGPASTVSEHVDNDAGYILNRPGF